MRTPKAGHSLTIAIEAALGEHLAHLIPSDSGAGTADTGTRLYRWLIPSLGGLSVSAPIERRQLEWIVDLRAAARGISAQVGWRAPAIAPGVA